MTIKHLATTAIEGLKAHKSRSSLTILGIVIGILAIMIVMSLGQGAQDLILNQLQGVGSRNIAVHPGREPKGPTDIMEMFTQSLKEKDVIALRNPSNVPGVGKVAPLVMYNDVVIYENETKRTSIIGTAEYFLETLNVYPDQGAMFTDEDIKQRASVAIIGSKVKEDLFGDSDALGKKIKIKDRVFRVVGVLAPKGNVAMLNMDEIVLAPYSTVQKYLMGVNYFQEILVEAATEKQVPEVYEDVKRTLREVHGITDPEKDDFHLHTMADAMKMVGTVMDALTLLLAAVAAVSLLVGGIGIMNIMLVSVTERTREIGLRKALGATGDNILAQFLLEAVILTAVGGFLGILLGAGIGWIIAFLFRFFYGINWQFVFPLKAALLGIGVAAVVGLIFGLYPAKKASEKSPIEALRYE